MSADLERFSSAQDAVYPEVLDELRRGAKRSHWMWFIFPQLAGLGRTATSRLYGIRDLQEASDYLEHPVLGPRLIECTNILLALDGYSAEAIFGFPDVLKLRSCLTLFAQASPGTSIFTRALDKYYGGEPDELTLQLLNAGSA